MRPIHMVRLPRYGSYKELAFADPIVDRVVRQAYRPVHKASPKRKLRMRHHGIGKALSVRDGATASNLDHHTE